MSLLFDLTASQPSATSKRHGGGKYCEILFFAMCQKKISFQAFFDSSKYINPKIFVEAKSANIKLHDIKEISLNQIVKTEKISNIYSALPEQILPWPNCNILGTIHGLRSFELDYDFFGHWLLDHGVIGLNAFLGYFSDKKRKKQIFEYYHKLLQTPNFSFVTDSNHSKKVIQSICPNLDIPVFYPPSTSTYQSEKNPHNKYILLVSADRFEKNCTRAFIAIDQLLSKKKISPDTKIKITGATHNISRYRIKNNANFQFLGYVDEDELDRLYANAYIFIYPSLNEGFGYPPLEAMKYGVPVIASNRASIPEVCEDAVLYCNPTSVKNIKKNILKIQNKATYDTISLKCFKQFKKITTAQNQDTENLIDWIINHN